MTANQGLHTDKRVAESLLVELAADLRHVPVEEATRALHTRALQLKRVVALWSVDSPDDRARRATCDEILALQREAREFRTRLRSGAQLVRRATKWRRPALAELLADGTSWSAPLSARRQGRR